MIVVALDDLLFSSKIRATAAHVGVPLVFARSRDAILAEVRKALPTLVIFDLNNPRTDPIGTVAAMKADPELRSIRTIGFVSHVDIATIEAAQRAGVDEVLPRSAFAQRLPEILNGAM
jgi:CheY-like chemotaxis protein